MPKITAVGRSQVDWGSTTACAQSRIIAERNARANLKTKAAKACPRGYIIKEGPKFTTLLDCDHQWNGWWPDVNTTIQATAKIECNKSGKYPKFAFIDEKADQNELYAAVYEWKEHYNAVIVSYDEIASINTVKKMENYLKKINNEKALKVFLESVEQGKVKTVVPPTLRSLITIPLYGDSLADIIEEEGITSIDNFLSDLDTAKKFDFSLTQKEGEHECLSKVVNINIRF